MNGWIATATSTLPDLTVTYEAVGSGGGREQFLGGGVQFAGTDAALKPEEKEAAVERCYGGEAIQLPLHQPHRGGLQPSLRGRRPPQHVC